jgi:regulatory protein
MNLLESDDAQILAQEMESRAVYLLSQREHGRKELAYKLSQKFPQSEDYPGLVDIVLDKCEDQRWLSDERYVEAYVRQAMEKEQGPYKIKQALQMRTDRQDLVEAYLAMEDSDWADIAASALERKYGDTAKPSQAKEQARRMRFLQSRGFSQSQIWKAFRNA